MGLTTCDHLDRRRRWAEMQGFTGLDDETLSRVDPWLRVAPALCMVWAAAGTVLGSPVVLAALVPFAVAGAIGPRHPFDAIYELGVRPRRGGPRIPPYGAPRRFACAVASAWLTAAGVAFGAGWTTLGRLLGGSLVVAAAVPTTTGFCIPSWIYAKLRRDSASTPTRQETSLTR